MANDKVKLGGVWKRNSKDGRVYYQGKISDNMKILIFEVQKKNEKQPDLEVFLAPADRPQPPAEGEVGGEKANTPTFVPPQDDADEFPGDV
jgi:hypothetical protein